MPVPGAPSQQVACCQPSNHEQSNTFLRSRTTRNQDARGIVSFRRYCSHHPPGNFLSPRQEPPRTHHDQTALCSCARQTRSCRCLQLACRTIFPKTHSQPLSQQCPSKYHPSINRLCPSSTQRQDHIWQNRGFYSAHQRAYERHRRPVRLDHISQMREYPSGCVLQVLQRDTQHPDVRYH